MQVLMQRLTKVHVSDYKVSFSPNTSTLHGMLCHTCVAYTLAWIATFQITSSSLKTRLPIGVTWAFLWLVVANMWTSRVSSLCMFFSKSAGPSAYFCLDMLHSEAATAAQHLPGGKNFPPPGWRPMTLGSPSEHAAFVVGDLNKFPGGAQVNLALHLYTHITWLLGSNLTLRSTFCFRFIFWNLFLQSQFLAVDWEWQMSCLFHDNFKICPFE